MNKNQALTRLNKSDRSAADAAAPWMGDTDEFNVMQDSPSSFIVVARVDDTQHYDMIYVFRMGLEGSKWAVSADVQQGTASQVFAAMQKRMP